MGSAITDAMGRQAPEGLIGIHIEPARDGPGRPRPAAGGIRAGTRGGRRGSRRSGTSGFGYFIEQATRPQTIGYALLDSPVALAAWMLDHDTDSYYKISRAFVDGEPAGNLTRDAHPRQHHAVLADRHRRVGRPVVLGERTSSSRSACGRPGSSGGLAPGRLHHVPRRDLCRPRAAGSRRSTRTSSTSTRSTGAATSPRGKSRSSSRRRSGRRSASACAERREP